MEIAYQIFLFLNFSDVAEKKIGSQFDIDFSFIASFSISQPVLVSVSKFLCKVIHKVRAVDYFAPLF